MTASVRSSIDVTSASATAIAAAIRNRDISAVEVVDACLRRIDEVNPAINAVVQVTADRARAAARAADAGLASGEQPGPLHGVPVTIKDALDVRGVVSTAGTGGRAQYVPRQDATAVARLQAAGAIVIGKTNVPEFSLAFETDNLVYGRTNNPYALDRTPGGSSGGEAAVIAAGGSSLGLGTDAAGSIRVPAHFCGIAGLKPTLGRVPLTGVFPPAVGALARMWHVGPLARRVEDLALALSVLAGPDGHDPEAAPVPTGEPNRVDLSELRVAFHVDNGVQTPTTETQAAVRSAADALDKAGAHVDEARPAGIEEGFELSRRLFAADGGASVGELLRLAGTQQPSPLLMQLASVLRTAAATSPAEMAGLLVQIDMFRARMLAFLQTCDAIVCPVNAYPALPHGQTFDEQHLPGFSYTMTYNLAGWPAVVVRAGTSADGLPIGVQVIARPWREEVALRLAAEIESATGGWQAPLL